jgi:hypothetical protein
MNLSFEQINMDRVLTRGTMQHPWKKNSSIHFINIKGSSHEAKID